MKPAHPDNMSDISDNMYLKQMEQYIAVNGGARSDFKRVDLYDFYIEMKLINKNRLVAAYHRDKENLLF